MLFIGYASLPQPNSRRLTSLKDVKLFNMSVNEFQFFFFLSNLMKYFIYQFISVTIYVSIPFYSDDNKKSIFIGLMLDCDLNVLLVGRSFIFFIKQMHGHAIKAHS